MRVFLSNLYGEDVAKVGKVVAADEHRDRPGNASLGAQLVRAAGSEVSHGSLQMVEGLHHLAETSARRYVLPLQDLRSVDAGPAETLSFGQKMKSGTWPEA